MLPAKQAERTADATAREKKADKQRAGAAPYSPGKGRTPVRAPDGCGPIFHDSTGRLTVAIDIFFGMTRERRSMPMRPNV